MEDLQADKVLQMEITQKLAQPLRIRLEEDTQLPFEWAESMANDVATERLKLLVKNHDLTRDKNNEIARLQGELADSEQKLSDKDKNIKDLNDEVGRLKTNKTDLESRVAELQGELAQSEQTLSGNSKDIKCLNDEVGRLKTNITDLEGRVAELRKRVES